MLGVAPVGGLLREVAIGFEPQVVQRVGVVIVSAVESADFAVVQPQGIDHLVLQDADQPGLELRAIGKRLRFGQRRQQGFRDGVFCPGLISQLKAGKALQIVTVRDQLLFKRRRGTRGHSGRHSVRRIPQWWLWRCKAIHCQVPDRG